MCVCMCMYVCVCMCVVLMQCIDINNSIPLSAMVWKSVVVVSGTDGHTVVSTDSPVVHLSTCM